MPRVRAVFVAAAAALLGGCISGYIAFGPGDDPPSVSLAASPSSAARGETIGLVAAANDDYLVVEVAFYRVDANGSTFLGRDSSAPYTLNTVVPAGAGTEVRYMARAIDDAGQRGDSQAVSVSVR